MRQGKNSQACQGTQNNNNHTVGDLPRFDKAGKLFQDIDAAVRKVKEEHPEELWNFRVLCVLTTVAFWASYGTFLYTGQRYCSVGIAASCIVYSSNIFHTRHHVGGKLYGIDWLDRLTYPMYEVIDRVLMIQPETWRYNHNYLHHFFVNSTTHDDDRVSAQDAGIRSHGMSPHHPYNKFQNIYVPLLLCLGVHTYAPVNYLVRNGSIVWIVLYYLSLYIVPYYLHGWEAPVLSFVSITVASFVIIHLNTLSHCVVGPGAPPELRQSLSNIDSVLKLQFYETLTWGNYFSCLWTGGLNYQIEHHCAPCLVPVSVMFSRLCVCVSFFSRTSLVLYESMHWIAHTIHRRNCTTFPLNWKRLPDGTTFPTNVEVRFWTFCGDSNGNCFCWVIQWSRKRLCK